MEPWSTLGISPTEDIRQIKRAYARQAAMFHPEENPQAFQAVYAAYRQALKLAQQPDKGSAESGDDEAYSENPAQPGENAADDLFDFAALSVQHHKEQQHTPVLREIARRLEDPKRCNNKLLWREFFLSDFFLLEYCQAGFMERLRGFLMALPDNDSLPRQFCAWIYVVSGWQYYKDFHRMESLSALRRLVSFLDNQQDARYTQSELRKKEWDEIRSSFAMFLRFLEHLQKQPDLEMWRFVVHPLPPRGYWNVSRSPVFTQLLGFAIRCLSVPPKVYPIIHQEYHLEDYARSSSKQLLGPLVRALEQMSSVVASTVDEQRQQNERARALYFSFYNFYHEKGFRAKITPDLPNALADFQTFLDEPYFEEVMLHPKLLEKLQDFYRTEGRIQPGSRAAMELVLKKYLPHKDNHLVAPLLVVLQEKFVIFEGQQQGYTAEYDDTERIRRFNPAYQFREKRLESVYDDCQQHATACTQLLSVAKKRVLASFSMLRTLCVLEACEPKPEYGKVEYYREMVVQVIRHAYRQPQEPSDMNFSFYRHYAKEFYDFLHNQRLLDTERFRHMAILLQSWYMYCDFQFIQMPEFAPDMVHGFILCPAALLLQTGGDALLAEELERVCQDSEFLLDPRNGYEEVLQRAERYGSNEWFGGLLTARMDLKLKAELNPQNEQMALCGEIAAYLDADCELIENMTDGEAVQSRWNALLKQGRREGFYPLMVVPSQALLERFAAAVEGFSGSTSAEAFATWRRGILEQSLALDGEAILKKRLMNYGRMEAPLGEFVECAPSHRFWGFMQGDAPVSSILIAKIAVQAPWELGAWIPVDGAEMPPAPELVAIFRYWWERYRAVPGAVTQHSWELKLAKPFHSETDTEEMARQQLAFCRHTVLQAQEGWDTIRAQASKLRHSTAWLLRW